MVKFALRRAAVSARRRVLRQRSSRADAIDRGEGGSASGLGRCEGGSASNLHRILRTGASGSARPAGSAASSDGHDSKNEKSEITMGLEGQSEDSNNQPKWLWIKQSKRNEKKVSRDALASRAS